MRSWIVATLLTMAVVARGGVVYDNTETQLPYVLTFNNGQEVGDQIWLGNYQTYPYLTNFSIEYYSTNSSYYGTVTADVRFYFNDGPLYSGYASPGTVFYDTGWFTVSPPDSYYAGTNSAVWNFTPADLVSGVVPMDPSMALPADFTVSVTFNGMGGSAMAGYDTLGLNDFESPTVGTNYGDYWLNVGGNWSLLEHAVPVAFAMQLNAASTPGAPILYITYSDNQAVVWWSPFISGWTLQTNSDLTTSNWGNYQGAVVNNRATNSAPLGTVFYRLKQ